MALPVPQSTTPPTPRFTNGICGATASWADAPDQATTSSTRPATTSAAGPRTSGRRGPRFTIGPEFAIESYLAHQGETFNTRFDANSYLYIAKAMDYWDLPARYGSLDAALARSRSAFLLLSFTSDWLYPTSESLIIVDALGRHGRPARHIELESNAGHDAFLVDYEPQGPIVEEFLAGL